MKILKVKFKVSEKDHLNIVQALSQFASRLGSNYVGYELEDEVKEESKVVADDVPEKKTRVRQTKTKDTEV